VDEPIIDPEQKAQLSQYHDLDALAGTWSEEDAAEFDQATVSFRQIDEELWRPSPGIEIPGY
jgi:hypothetical protein